LKILISFYMRSLLSNLIMGYKVSFKIRMLEVGKNLFIIIGITVLLLIIGHYAIGGARYIKHSIKGIRTGQAHTDDLKLSPAFAGFDDYDEYFTEIKKVKMNVVPYYHWRRGSFDGKAVSIDNDSIRKTIKSPNDNAKKVFMFGGSTTWGTGTPDRYTIASYLQKLLGEEFDVYNFGETAFVSVQELNLLLENLSNGFIPDIVIFYDGVNDVFASLYSPGIPRHPQFRPEDYANKESVSYLVSTLINKTNYVAITERIRMLLKKDIISQWGKNVADGQLEKTLIL